MPGTTRPGTTRPGALTDRQLNAFVDPARSGRVEGIAEHLDHSRYSFTSSHGSVTWRRVADGTRWRYEIEQRSGVDLLDAHDTTRFLGLDHERSAALRGIDRSEHGRPYAYESLSQLFDDPKTPASLSVPASPFPFHGNIGNHGALTSVQCRGLFLAAGPGVAASGWVNDHGRLIDVAPTLLALLATPVGEGISSTGAWRADARLRAQDGDEMRAVLDPSTGPARHVVAVVFDGTNTNLLADAVAAGEMPNVASLLARGAGLRHGIISSFPTVTLPNHTTAFTGVHPGRHGIIHNEFLNEDGSPTNRLDFASMVHVQDWLSADVETVHEAVSRWRSDAFTSASYEYADRGAAWSTFAEFRAKRRPFFATPEMVAASATSWAIDASASYRFESRIDESSLGSAIEQWRGPAHTGHALPTLQLVNFSLTDGAGHESGPHEPLARAAQHDSDRRLGRLIDAITAAGALEHTAIVVLSDHGMEQCDPSLLHHPMMGDAGHAAMLAEHGIREIGDVLLHLD